METSGVERVPVYDAGGRAGVEDFPSCSSSPIVNLEAGGVWLVAGWFPVIMMGVEISGDDNVRRGREGGQLEPVCAVVVRCCTNRRSVDIEDVERGVCTMRLTRRLLGTF